MMIGLWQHWSLLVAENVAALFINDVSQPTQIVSQFIDMFMYYSKQKITFRMRFIALVDNHVVTDHNLFLVAVRNIRAKSVYMRLNKIHVLPPS